MFTGRSLITFLYDEDERRKDVAASPERASERATRRASSRDERGCSSKRKVTSRPFGKRRPSSHSICASSAFLSRCIVSSGRRCLCRDVVPTRLVRSAAMSILRTTVMYARARTRARTCVRLLHGHYDPLMSGFCPIDRFKNCDTVL